jgi:hypothetical protein
MVAISLWMAVTNHRNFDWLLIDGRALLALTVQLTVQQMHTLQRATKKAPLLAKHSIQHTTFGQSARTKMFTWWFSLRGGYT